MISATRPRRGGILDGYRGSRRRAGLTWLQGVCVGAAVGTFALGLVSTACMLLAPDDPWIHTSRRSLFAKVRVATTISWSIFGLGVGAALGGAVAIGRRPFPLQEGPARRETEDAADLRLDPAPSLGPLDVALAAGHALLLTPLGLLALHPLLPASPAQWRTWDLAQRLAQVSPLHVGQGQAALMLVGTTTLGLFVALLAWRAHSGRRRAHLLRRDAVVLGGGGFLLSLVGLPLSLVLLFG